LWVADVKNGQEALEAIEKFNPTVTILDIDMPVMNGFEVAREIKARKLTTEIIFLTMHRDEDLFNEAIDLGPKGFVLKDSALEDIVECINAVVSKKHFTSHALTSFLINRGRRNLQLTEKQPSINDLTQTESRILKLIAENLTSREIGEQLFISPRTVEKHRSNICEKLNLQSSHSLFKFALRHKSELF
jgi:DNA-binding NarL/FixJ family response regulator